MAENFDFQPLDPEVRRAPYSYYARGREDFPVHRHEGLPLPLVSVFRYADVQDVLRDPELFSSVFQVDRQFAAEELGPPMAEPMITTDPPEHTRLRGLVNRAFTPRIIQRLEPRMREISDALVAEAVAARDVDLIQALTYPLPVTVIAEIIGIPTEDRAQFKEWSDRLVSNLGVAFLAGADIERAKKQRALLLEMREYFIPLAEKRKEDPREDLLTGLVRAEHEGSKLDHDEMLQMLVLLLAAGNETTTTLISNAVLELIAYPGEAKRLRDDPSLIPSAVEEVMRFASPVQFDPRRTTREVQVGGVTLEPETYVLCWLASANRDASVFADPDVFDVTREKNPHMGFGFGTHYCLGANLARHEARVALESLLAATRDIELTTSEPLPIHPSPVFRAVTQLPVRLA